MRTIIILLLLIVPFSGCYTAKKAMRQDVKVQSLYPEISASNCAKWYPPIIKTETDTKYIRGEDRIEYRTISFDCDSAIKAAGRGIVNVQCPETKTRVDTQKVVTLQTVANVAREAELLLKYEKVSVEKVAAETKLKGSKKLNWILGGVLALIGVGMYLKPKFL